MHMYSTRKEVEGYKADLVSRTDKRYLWLTAVDRRNCLSIIHIYTQRFRCNITNNVNWPPLGNLQAAQHLIRFKNENTIFISCAGVGTVL